MLVLFDVSSKQRHEVELKAAQELAQAMVETARDPLLVLDSELRIQGANRSFLELVGAANDPRGQPLAALGPAWDHPELHRLLADVLPHQSRLDGFVLERAPAPRLRLQAHSVLSEDHRPFLILLRAEQEP